MQISTTALALMIATALLASGCNKKAEDGTTSTTAAATPAAKATGVKGTVNGKPFAGKVAWLSLDQNDEHQAKIDIKEWDASCSVADILNDKNGTHAVNVFGPAPKKGTTKFDGKVAFANIAWQKGNTTSSTDTSHGEIEWITVPTATTKGLVRVVITKEEIGAKIEGSMEVAMCVKK